MCRGLAGVSLCVALVCPSDAFSLILMEYSVDQINQSIPLLPTFFQVSGFSQLFPQLSASPFPAKKKMLFGCNLTVDR